MVNLIRVYGNKGCVNCEMVKNVLDSKDIDYEYLILDNQDDKDSIINKAEKNGIKSMPIVMRNNNIINWRGL